MFTLDHIALGARDLATSSQALSQMLGAEPFGGGEHELFGTHNKLWRIETPKYPIYLELLAVNPNAKAKRARWFGLETPITDDHIHLLGFVAGTRDINSDVRSAPFDTLSVIDVARGELRWKFGITKDGALLRNGGLPYLIEWQNRRHPLEGVGAQSISLTRISGQLLRQISLDWPILPHIEADYSLHIELQSADGKRHQFSRP